jgi:hypothetical protein
MAFKTPLVSFVGADGHGVAMYFGWGCAAAHQPIGGQQNGWRQTKADSAPMVGRWPQAATAQSHYGMWIMLHGGAGPAALPTAT